MTSDKTTAQEDLAFLRRLIAPTDDGGYQRAFGTIYGLWGVAFAVPLALEWARLAGLIVLPPSFWPVTAAVVSVAVLVAWIALALARKMKPAVGVQARAANAVFAGIGWANLAVLLGLFLVADHTKAWWILMVHGMVVFAFQGAAWYTVWALRKVAWHGVVAGGWFVAAAAMGATLPQPSFVLVAAISLTLLMAVPGWVMVRTAPAA